MPAARPDAITEANVDRLNTRIVAEGANIPATPGAEKILYDKGVLVLPDFVANAGGVICAAMEYHGANQTVAFDTIAEKLTANTREMLARAKADEVMPRAAAFGIAEERVRRAMTTRRFSIF